tara:strand:+ start:293 stop:1198 length:906 start_codon:yes stop_codon:yes gene_type:complete
MVKKRKKIKEGDKAYNPNEARNKAIAMARKMKKLREKKTKITKPKTKIITKITIKPKTKKTKWTKKDSITLLKKIADGMIKKLSKSQISIMDIDKSNFRLAVDMRDTIRKKIKKTKDKKGKKVLEKALDRADKVVLREQGKLKVANGRLFDLYGKISKAWEVYIAQNLPEELAEKTRDMFSGNDKQFIFDLMDEYDIDEYVEKKLKMKTKKITKITIKQTKKTKVKKKTLTAVRMKKHLTQINKQLRKELIKGVWKMRKPELTKAFNKHMEIMDDGWYRPTDDLKELYENKKWDFEAFKKL